MNPNDPITNLPSPVKPLKHIIEYYFNSNAKYREYNLNENDQWHGLFEQWYFSGQPWVRCNCQNDLLHGLYEEWYDTGSLRHRCLYNNGDEI